MSSSACSANNGTALPRLAVTPGEPAGIGPDLVVALNNHDLPARLVLLADRGLLQARAAQLGLPFAAPDYRSGSNDRLCVLPIPLPVAAVPGNPNPANAAYVLAGLDRAVAGCLSGEFDALVTGPVQKSVINAAGAAFSGHTEYLAARTGGARATMLLTDGTLRVALVTTHLPLAEVPRAVTAEAVRDTITTVARALSKHYGISRPTLLVCGLNPHAGEDGILGHEDRTVIAPVLESLRKSGLTLIGPVPADTAFVPERLDGVDAVVAMYHDQGLPVVKSRGFGNAINVTLGLPIIRTSVDHGTALDLAGTGRADPGSLHAAIREAARLVGVPPRQPPATAPSRGRAP